MKFKPIYNFFVSIHVVIKILGIRSKSLVLLNLLFKSGHSLLNCVYHFLIQNFINYLIALIFLGFGWNFLFISGTSLLVLSYREDEKFKAQGFNDLIVYSIQAVASLSAGVFLTLTSWKTMNLVCIIFLVIIILSTLRADFKERK